MSQVQTKLEHIAVPFELKDISGDAKTFSGLAATWDLDLGGDVIEPGAFKRTISDWKRTKGAGPNGRRVHKLLDSHDRMSIFSALGMLLEAEETDKGVLGTWQFRDGQTGEEARDLVKSGVIDSLSIGYHAMQTKEPNDDQRRTGVFRFIKELRWVETSLVQFPMNPAATVDAATVKSLLEADRPLTHDELTYLIQQQQDIGALLSRQKAAEGLAPEDADRLALESRARDLRLQSLGIR